MQEDVEKASRLWEAMNEATGDNQPFPVEEFQDIINVFQQQMEEEDKDALLCCTCHGEFWPARDVDMWGLCPFGRD